MPGQDRLIDEILGKQGFPEPVRRDKDDVLAFRQEVEREDAFDRGPMDLFGPVPLEVGQQLELAETASFSRRSTRWRVRASSSALTSCSSNTIGLQRFCVARATRSFSSSAVWRRPRCRR